MATQWHVSGEKQGKNVGVIWHFDVESRVLIVSFAILSVTRLERSVRKAIAQAFELPEYTPVAELNLPPGVPAMRFVTAGLANVDKILNDQQVTFFSFSTVF